MIQSHPAYFPEASEDGLYAGVELNDQTHLLGGPFRDIDDVLDACFNHRMEHDIPTTRYFELRVSRGKQTAMMLPHEALPTDGEGDAAIGAE